MKTLKINCLTGEVTEREMTPKEEAAHVRSQAAVHDQGRRENEARDEALAQDEADLALIAAAGADNPTIAAIARQLFRGRSASGDGGAEGPGDGRRPAS